LSDTQPPGITKCVET